MNQVAQQGAAGSADIVTGLDWGTLIEAIVRVIRNPGANTTLSVLVLACAILAVLILALVVVGFATPRRRRVVRVRRYTGVRPSEPTAGTQDTRSMTPAETGRKPAGVIRSLRPGVGLALVVIALAGGYLTSSTDQYCAMTCHSGSEAAATASKSAHANCSRCHEVGGAGGVVANTVSRSRMLVAFATGADPNNESAVVHSDRCLRCHREIRDGLTAADDGVRMSHREVIDAALPCVSCHAGSGHAPTATPPMRRCLPCHDAKVASADCGTCHARDPSSTVVVSATEGEPPRGKLVYPAVRAAGKRCGGCHDEKNRCDPCHGIRMPHSQRFREGAHARAAAFEAKLRCWKCHDPQWCSNGGCHGAVFYAETGSTTHGNEWRREHQEAEWDAGCVCHQGGRSQRDFSICRRCHAADRSLLDVTF